MTQIPETRYATTEDGTSIAYQTVGDGPLDLVLELESWGNVDIMWELADVLALPIASVLATYRRDGGVLLSPVWHQWRDGGFDVTCFPGDTKVRHLTNDPRASLLLYDHAPPLRGLELRTEAVLSGVEGTEIIRDMAFRYLGEEAGNAYADGVGNEFVLARLEPGNVRTWDFEGEF